MTPAANRAVANGTASIGGASIGARLRAAWRHAVCIARLAIGVPDYDTYLAHMRREHPAARPMSYEEFFNERLAARYGKGRSRCC